MSNLELITDGRRCDDITSSGRMLVVFAIETPIETASIDHNLFIGSNVIINNALSDQKPKAVKYPSQRVVNKYRTPKIPKIPKNTRK